jgi:hypothetical protein
MDQENYQAGRDDEHLDALFGVYRAAFPDAEPSPNFMPRLWQNIEARERKSTMFGRLARNVMTAALALSTLLAIAASISSNRTPLTSETYVEVLAEDHARQNLDYFEPVHISTVADHSDQR